MTIYWCIWTAGFPPASDGVVGSKGGKAMASLVRGILSAIKEKGVGGFIKHLRDEGYTWVLPFSSRCFAYHSRPYRLHLFVFFIFRIGNRDSLDKKWLLDAVCGTLDLNAWIRSGSLRFCLIFELIYTSAPGKKKGEKSRVIHKLGFFSLILWFVYVDIDDAFGHRIYMRVRFCLLLISLSIM